MELYRHTQTGPWWIFAVGIVALVVVGGVAGDADALLAALLAVFAVLMVAVLLIATRLTVVADPEGLTLFFGWGWPRKRILFANVERATQVRNSWWYGFGIRKIPRGWMWNVYGLDAIEVTSTAGKPFRIGTDEPEALLAVVSTHVRSG